MGMTLPLVADEELGLVRDANNCVVFTCHRSAFPGQTDVVHMAQIVRAVNAHDELVAACQKACRLIGQHNLQDSRSGLSLEASDVLETALRRAGAL